MILEIRLSNFFSIKDEVVLDMQAASIQTKKAKELEENTFVCGDERLLKTVAIYGANASGKSSLIKAIRACVGMIFSSHNYKMCIRDRAGSVHQLHAGTNRLRHPLAHVQRREDILPGGLSQP